MWYSFRNSTAISIERKSRTLKSSSFFNAVFFLPLLAITLLQDASQAYFHHPEQQEPQDILLVGNNTTNSHHIRRSTSDFSLVASQSHHSSPHQKKPISFYVMGDTPYKSKESILLTNQLKEVYQDRYLSHIFHVGDLMRKGDCKEWRYQHASNLLFHTTTTTTTTLSPVPILVLPGDNDWLDCPNRTLAFRQFKRHFIVENPPIQNIDESYEFNRQAQSSENFVLWKDHILFFGLNMLGRKDGLWKRRYELNIEFFLHHFHRHHNPTAAVETEAEDSIRLIVIVAHSIAARPVYHAIRKVTRNTNIPVLYIHGNGHVYNLTQERDDFVKIQLDRGGIAPPLKVQVYGEEDGCGTSTNSYNNDTSAFTLFSGLVCIDRRLT